MYVRSKSSLLVRESVFVYVTKTCWVVEHGTTLRHLNQQMYLINVRKIIKLYNRTQLSIY